jgi:ferredoxin
MKVNRKIIRIDEELCDGCGQCIPSCAEGALQVVDGKARLVKDIYCDGLGACLGECPTGALSIIKREAEDFDEDAVEEYLRSKEQDGMNQDETMACGCPSTQIQSFIPSGSREEANIPTVRGGQNSTLTHWPVQIRLIPPTAPFLKGADLLVAADCTPVAYPNFHRDFIKGKVVMVGCPKFDDRQEYVQKFADIFRTADIKSITIVMMEVPCCHGLPAIVEKGMEMAGKKVPMEKVLIGGQGDILGREKQAA